MEEKEKSTTTATFEIVTPKPGDSCPECAGMRVIYINGITPVKCVSCGGTGRVAENSATTEASAAIRHFTTAQAAREILTSVDEARARAWVTARLFPEGASCPHCGLVLDSEDAARFFEGKRCECGRCGRFFTSRTGTFLNGAQLDDRQAVLMAALIDFMENGLTPARIAEIIGVSADTVRLWAKRFNAFGK